MSQSLLPIYLNDHLAGATVGVELASRASRSNRGSAEFGEPLARICEEIEADKASLEAVMAALGVSRDRVKPLGAWVAEKLGRLKLNGRLRGYSPLSRVLELEGLYLGISGKLRLWSLLGERADERLEEFDLPRLAARAERQRGEVETLQSAAARLI
jgi:hypothetical protein